MQVKIRGDWEPRSDARVLGDVPLEQAALDRTMQLIRKWGVSDADDDSFTGPELFGQFVMGRGEAYFEIVVVTE